LYLSVCILKNLFWFVHHNAKIVDIGCYIFVDSPAGLDPDVGLGLIQAKSHFMEIVL
jgi:hypothetical protein